MKVVLSLEVHFNTDKINVYVHYSDTSKFNIQTMDQMVRFQSLSTQA